MQFGSAGVGSGSHFSCAKLNAALGIDPVHVPYRSSGLAAQDLMGGRIDYICALGGTAIGPVESGMAKAISLLTAERSALFPELATSKEQGIAGVDSYFWTAFLFPKSTPDAIVRSFHDATNRTLDSAVTAERLRKTGIEPIAAARRSPAYLREFMPAEMKNWADQVKASGCRCSDVVLVQLVAGIEPSQPVARIERKRNAGEWARNAQPRISLLLNPGYFCSVRATLLV